ncbi:hypothetical protein [Sphingobium sp. CCH11-B1]|uniref:hypothetical protein n=1 Tax=Sphingobium sp. CCH11-B1 TaxID=1768781 RepID=UPI000A691968|nr:hypothetical protein [Sphingobium sp. CCH11-B1]
MRTGPASLDDAVWATIIQTRGQTRIERYWDSYVAFTTSDTAAANICAPMSDLG